VDFADVEIEINPMSYGKPNKVTATCARLGLREKLQE